MNIQSKIQGTGLQNRSPQSRLLGTVGLWSVAILCGSIVAACSGTIETPTEEFPPRAEGREQAVTDDDTADQARTPPRAPAAAAPRDNDPPAAAAADDDTPPVASADDEDDEPAPPAQEEETAAVASDLSFESDIQPIFNTTCGPCHAGAGLGGQNIGANDIDTALADAIDFEDRVLATIETGSMPPACGSSPPGSSGCMSEDDFADVQAWYEAGTPE